MRQHGAWQVLDVLQRDLDQIKVPPSVSLILMDSIWLTPQAFPFFLRLRNERVALGVILHSLPSLIAASEAGLPTPPGPTAFEKEALARLDLMAAVGPHYPQMFRELPLSVLVASPGLEEQWRCAPRDRHGPCRLVSVGAVTERKGFLEVCEALKLQSPSETWRWDVVGSRQVDPDYARRVEESSAELTSQRAGKVVFHGQLEPHRTQRLVQKADVLVMPSFDENHPLVLLEAMAASTPSVAYAAGAARNMIEHEGQGLIAPIGDRRQLAAHLCRVIDDEPLRRRLAEGCWKTQATLPSWSASAESTRRKLRQFVALYLESPPGLLH